LKGGIEAKRLNIIISVEERRGEPIGFIDGFYSGELVRKRIGLIDFLTKSLNFKLFDLVFRFKNFS
jgi:hypothetical protein